MQELSIEGFELSPQQKSLWLLQQNQSQPYRVNCAVLIEGNLKIKVLEAALQKVVERHEILRTSFCCLSGMSIALQVISDCNLPEVKECDLKQLEFEEQEAKLEVLFQEAKKHPFDLSHGSNLQVSLAILSPEKHILLLGLPALCADRIAIDNLVGEISQSYAASIQNSPLGDEPLQYADIAAWQNELFEAEEAETGKEYWRNLDLNFIQSTLPNEKPLISVFKPESISLKLNTDINTKIAALANKEIYTISSFLQTCWQILLWRITGKSEIGIACDGRNHEELEPAIGLLAKYLPIQGCLQGELKFYEVWPQLNKITSDALTWQESFNWEYLVKSNTQNKETPFFPFCFEFESQPPQYSAADLLFSIYKSYTCIDRFKVKLSCKEQNDSLTAELHYDANLFETEEIERLAAQFQTLLTHAIENPEVAIAQLEILNSSQRQQLLVEFNNNKTAPPPYSCLHHWFEAQAQLTPNNIALVFEDRQLTYAELNIKANQLAHYLQRLGVKPEIIVALHLERSPELIVGLLGILKAGGAYLPLDPALPKEALALRMQEAQATILLTQQHLIELQPQAQVVCLDNWDAAKEDHSNPISHTTAQNLAYVIYTSGSTGKPKGVAIEHRQLLNYLNAILEKLVLPSGASFATVSTIAADLGNTAIFPALCTGGCLHIISQERATDPVALAQYCRRHPIDCLKIVPTHLAALLTTSHPEQILPRQCLILGGEAVSWNLISQVRQHSPCQILNHYGPTETTVGVLTYSVKSLPTEASRATVPLGRPLANTQIYLLDTHQQPVPIGVPGELYIGGDCVARGYLNQPELTAQRFIPNPFNQAKEDIVGWVEVTKPNKPSELGAFNQAKEDIVVTTKKSSELGFACAQPNLHAPQITGSWGDRMQPSTERLYKTGDLARYRPDGTLEFLGRLDRQVKLHGFRIELEEVEAVLSQHPKVREVVVLAREDEPDQKRLVAYVVPDSHTATISDLSNFLKQKLPEYMVPSAFVLLKALPLTPNGKIDRHNLPAPDATKPEFNPGFSAPRNPQEKVLAEIWAQILGLEQVGIYDNFFELGGDSILSIQVIARANKANLRLTPKQIFEYPTIAQLAAVADIAQTIEIEQGLVTGFVPLTPIQHWFFEQNLPDSHHWNQAILLQVQHLDPKLLEQVVQHLLKHHDALRLRFIPEASGWRAVNTDYQRVVPVTVLDLSTLSPSEQTAAIEAAAGEQQASLNLSAGSLMAVTLFNLGPSKPSRLLLIIHHLAVDSVSWRILLEDLQTAYEQVSRNEPIQLPAKTTSFKQWAECLQEYAQSTTLRKEQDYWLAPRQRSHLPVDFPNRANTVGLARTVSVSLSESQTQALLKEVPSAYQTQVNDVLLTALVQTFADWTQQRSLLVNLEGHGREEIIKDVDLSRTVGWFTTLFPVLLELEAASEPGEALKAIKEQLRQIPNRGIGYGVLRYLQPDPSVKERSRQLPQPEVCFNYLGQFDPALQQSSLFSLAPESSGAARSPQGNRPHLLDITGFVVNGKLQLDWTYSAAKHKNSTVSSLAQKFLTACASLIAHCQSAEAGGYTPTDFPKAQLNQKDLDKLLAKINRTSEKKAK